MIYVNLKEISPIFRLLSLLEFRRKDAYALRKSSLWDYLIDISLIEEIYFTDSDLDIKILKPIIIICKNLKSLTYYHEERDHEFDFLKIRFLVIDAILQMQKHFLEIFNLNINTADVI
jgi:hypothetical protein